MAQDLSIQGEPSFDFWAQIVRAIELLDGDEFSELGVSRGPIGFMADPNRDGVEDVLIGAGGDQLVSVMHFAKTAQGTVDYFAVQRQRGDDTEIRGPWGTELPARMWVAKEVATRALHHFVEHGGRAPDLDWEFDFLDPAVGPTDVGMV
jgi:hypothetical protein